MENVPEFIRRGVAAAVPAEPRFALLETVSRTLTQLTEEQERDEIRTCAKMFEDFTGARPTGWRSP